MKAGWLITRISGCQHYCLVEALDGLVSQYALKFLHACGIPSFRS